MVVIAAAGADRETPQPIPTLQERLARAELLAGLTPVEGPGVVILLRHSPRAVPRGIDKRGFQIHDQDVNAVLNALRAAGAEALAIGSADNRFLERVLANTAAAEAGPGILVNGTRLDPPYRVLAIGDTTRLRAELLRSGGVVRKAGLDALSMVQVDDARDLAIPAARSVGRFRFARTAGTAVGSAPGGTPMPMPAAATAPMPGGRRADPSTHVGSSPPQPPGHPAVLFGGKGLTRFHLSGCRFGERIEPSRRVVFGSAREAKKSGRIPCVACLPNPPTALRMDVPR